MEGATATAAKPHEAERKACLIGLGLIVLLGAFLRLYMLGYTALWIDEVTVFGGSGVNRTAADIVQTIYEDALKGPTGQHMPLQYVLANLSHRLYQWLSIEPTPFWSRLPFALLGILTIPFMYAIGAGYFSRRVGLWTAALMSFSFFHVYQSRDATSYAPLLFFLAVNAYGLKGMIISEKGYGRRKLIWAVFLVIGTLGALFTHLSAWFVVATEGLLMVLAVMTIALRRADEKTTNYFAAARFLVVPMVLLGLCCLPFLTFILAAAQGAGGQAGGSVDTFSISLLMYQLAHFGWGRGAGRLVVFLVVLIVGVVGTLRSELRHKAILLLAMCVIPAVLFFFVLKRGFAPRYLSVSFLPLIMLAGAGTSKSVDWVADRLKFPGKLRLIPAAVLCAVLAAWHMGPYRTLYGAQDKLMPMSRIRDWIVANVPERGLYVMRNGYHLREVPGVHSVGDRQVAFADFPNAGIPLQQRQWQGSNARSIMERFPLAPWIADSQYPFGEDANLWTWIYSDFTRKEPLFDDTIEKLWAWGFCPHGINVKQSTRFMAYFNTKEDVIWRDRGRKAVSYWPEGPNWVFRQTQEGSLLFAPLSDAALTVVKHSRGTQKFMLVISGVSMIPGHLAGRVVGTGAVQDLPAVRFERSNPLELKMGPLVLAQGETSIRLSQSVDKQVPLLIHSIELRVVEEPADKQEDNPEAT